MLNRIWFWLLLIGIVYGPAKGARAAGRSQLFSRRLRRAMEVKEAPPSFAELGKRVDHCRRGWSQCFPSIFASA